MYKNLPDPAASWAEFNEGGVFLKLTTGMHQISNAWQFR
jgi:hypothetical protein